MVLEALLVAAATLLWVSAIPQLPRPAAAAAAAVGTCCLAASAVASGQLDADAVRLTQTVLVCAAGQRALALSRRVTRPQRREATGHGVRSDGLDDRHQAA